MFFFSILWNLEKYNSFLHCYCYLFLQSLPFFALMAANYAVLYLPAPCSPSCPIRSSINFIWKPSRRSWTRQLPPLTLLRFLATLSLSDCCFTSCFVRTHSDTQPEGAELRHQKQKGEKFKRRLPTELNEHERNSHEQELSARFSTVSEESASWARMNHKESKRVSHCCSGRFFLYDPRKTPFCLRWIHFCGGSCLVAEGSPRTDHRIMLLFCP